MDKKGSQLSHGSSKPRNRGSSQSSNVVAGPQKSHSSRISQDRTVGSSKDQRNSSNIKHEKQSDSQRGFNSNRYSDTKLNSSGWSGQPAGQTAALFLQNLNQDPLSQTTFLQGGIGNFFANSMVPQSTSTRHARHKD